jgi:hypothetical protein
MMNDGACASWLRGELKQLPGGEMLDVSAWKRFDTDGCLFGNRNARQNHEEARWIIEARKL